MKREDDWIKEIDKKIIHYMWTIFLSMMISIITTLSVVRTLGTVIGSGSIEYLTPYARRQYYEHKSKARWFEKMKASNKEAILKGAEQIAGR